MDRHERLRLLYVAATRARDHLVVSVHRKKGGTDSTAAELFHATGWEPSLIDVLDLEGTDEHARAAPATEPAPVSLPSLADWERQHATALASGSRRLAVSATQLAKETAGAAEAQAAAGLHKDPRDLDLPPWQKGRYGSAVGRAVHAVLQAVDLVTGDGMGPAAAAQAAAEGVLGKEGIIEALCRSALDSDLVRRASARPHWREVYVGVPSGEGVLEGYVDLLYRDDDGLVVVDYKTDTWRTQAELAAKVARYRVQLDADARAVAEATGEPVAHSQLLFLAADESSRGVTLPAVAPAADAGVS
jgi:ATP-dependent helicase/nuclease subunit A